MFNVVSCDVTYTFKRGNIRNGLLRMQDSSKTAHFAAISPATPNKTICILTSRNTVVPSQTNGVAKHGDHHDQSNDFPNAY